jgi:hypothetical protein
VLGFDSFVPSDDGRWVSEKFERLARVVQDYDPQFELRWIPPDQRETPDERSKPYVIWDTISNSAAFFASELDTPEDILTKLFEGDNTKHNVLERLDARNAAIKALEMKEQMDLAEERREYATWLMETNKNFINLGGGRKVDDQLRPLQ